MPFPLSGALSLPPVPGYLAPTCQLVLLWYWGWNPCQAQRCQAQCQLVYLLVVFWC